MNYNYDVFCILTAFNVIWLILVSIAIFTHWSAIRGLRSDRTKIMGKVKDLRILVDKQSDSIQHIYGIMDGKFEHRLEGAIQEANRILRSLLDIPLSYENMAKEMQRITDLLDTIYPALFKPGDLVYSSLEEDDILYVVHKDKGLRVSMNCGVNVIVREYDINAVSRSEKFTETIEEQYLIRAKVQPQES